MIFIFLAGVGIGMMIGGALAPSREGDNGPK
jgi:hypothetical protein